MIHKKYKFSSIVFLTLGLLFLYASCTRDLEEPTQAKLPSTQEIFLDGFSAGLKYSAFGGSNVSAFDVDKETKYKGTAAMRFDIPDSDDTRGAYAAGVFHTDAGRDLSGYTALTFWAKATESVSIDQIGFGFTFEEDKYSTAIYNLSISTGWRKYVIPMADPSKLTAERGLLYYIDTPEEGKGYSFWVDEVKFENLGTIANPRPAILEGQDQTIETETGDKISIDGLFSTLNLPDGADQRVEVGYGYFTFSSSSTSVAMVNEMGEVSVIDSGKVVITAKLGELDATGSLTISSIGAALQPLESAPSPTIPSDSVISLFSNTYEDVPVDTWDTGWEFSDADVEDVQINGDDVKRYRNLNFVGIEFSSQTIDATAMTHFHMDIWTPDPTDLPNAFKVLLVDFGPDNSFGGGDGSSHELSVSSPTLATEAWVSIDVPLSFFAGLTTRGNLAQMVLSGDLQNVFVDNVYFYIGEDTGGPTAPEEPAPTPTQNAADVISVFSDAYTNIEETDFFPDWGQSTVVTTEQIADNNTLKYASFSFQGTQFSSAQNISSMEYMHIDMWTADATVVQVTPISVSTGESLFTLAPITAGQWNSYEIPLSAFTDAGVFLSDIHQLKFDGQAGTSPSNIYLDNIYFYKKGVVATEPTEPAPTPTQNEANVISLFSDAYTDVNVDTWRTDWSAATLEDVTIEGNAIKKYSELDFVGIETVANPVDASNMTHIHMDVWSGDFTFFGVKLVDLGADGIFGGDDVEHQINFEMPVQGSWVNFDIPLSDFSGLTSQGHLGQYILVGQPTGATTVYLDNVYLYNEGGTIPMEPGMAAPTPTQDAANVISVFSDTYTNLEGTNLNPNWGQGTVASEVSVAGNNTLMYSGLDFQGIELAMSQDVSGMEYLHIDFWTSNSTALNAFLISGGPVETAYALTVPTEGWSSVEIPLSAFDQVNLGDVIQFKFDGNGDIYLDNIYFYTEGGGIPTSPEEAAPIPTIDSADVISIFSDAYTNLDGTNLNPDWGQGTVATEVSVANNNTLMYSGLDYQGIELAMSQDVSGMQFLHIDYWTSNSTALNVFLISTGPVETLKALTVPTSGWVSLDIPLTDFTSVNLADVIQMKFDGNGDIYIDNIYFRK